MGQTTEQIKDEIEQQRQELGQNLQQLETKVKDTVDWRAQFQQRPLTGVGIAFGAGFLLSMLTGGSDSKKQQQAGHHARSETSASQASTTHREQHKQPSPEMQEISETFDNIRGAVLGLAATRLRSFLAETIPGFEEEYEEARRKRGASEETKVETQGSSHSSHSDRERSSTWDRPAAGTTTPTYQTATPDSTATQS